MARHRLFFLAACVIAAALADGQPSTAQAGAEIAIEARSLQPGELVVVTITFASEPTDVRVTALGGHLPSFRLREHVWRALAGIDLEQPAGPATIEVEAHGAQGEIHARRELDVLPKRFEVRTLNVAPDFVNPPASAQSRIL